MRGAQRRAACARATHAALRRPAARSRRLPQQRHRIAHASPCAITRSGGPAAHVARSPVRDIQFELESRRPAPSKFPRTETAACGSRFRRAGVPVANTARPRRNRNPGTRDRAPRPRTAGADRSTPPATRRGRATRARFRVEASTSNQCSACATVTRSTDASGRPERSAGATE